MTTLSQGQDFRFAVLSNVFPPAPSGQAVMLYKLLKDFPPDRYCLLQQPKPRWPLTDDIATETLPSELIILDSAPNFGVGAFPLKPIFLQALLTIAFFGKRLAGVLVKENCKLLIACSGDLNNLPVAFLACKKAKIPFIVYLFDDYAFQWRGVRRILSRLFEPFIIKRADGLIVTNEFTQREYLRRYGKHSEIIHNPCVIQDLAELDREKRLFDDSFVNIVYTGAVYEAHYGAFKNLVTALKALPNRKIKIHIFAGQRREIERLCDWGGFLEMHDHINHLETLKFMRQADILFLPLAFDSPYPELIKTASPGKIGEYLSVARPILVHAPEESFASWYHKENKCGVVVDENNPSALAGAIEEIIDNSALRQEMAINAIERARKDFSLSNVAPKFASYIHNVKENYFWK